MCLFVCLFVFVFCLSLFLSFVLLAASLGGWPPLVGCFSLFFLFPSGGLPPGSALFVRLFVCFVLFVCFAAVRDLVLVVCLFVCLFACLFQRTH